MAITHPLHNITWYCTFDSRRLHNHYIELHINYIILHSQTNNYIQITYYMEFTYYITQLLYTNYISEPASAYVYVLNMSCYIACIRALNMHTYIQCICITQNAYVSMCMYGMYVYVCVHMSTHKCICQYCMYCLYVYVCVYNTCNIT